MPRFFFDFHDGDEVSPDTVGVDLPDEEVARAEATRTLSEIAAQEIPDDGPRRQFRIEVHDENGQTLFQVQIDFMTQRADSAADKD